MGSNGNASNPGAAGSADLAPGKRHSKRPKYSKFTQQELPACKPILTPFWVIGAFFIVTVVFVPIGFTSLISSHNVAEIISQYETDCIPPESRIDKVGFIQISKDKACTRILTVKKHMKAPIYIYYQLDNFHQNHRRYVKSRSDKQLRDAKYETDTSACKPEDSLNGKAIVPCGLVAWSMFNDTYSFSLNNQSLIVNKKGIAWKSDRDYKFGKNVFPQNFQSNGTLKGGAQLDPTKPLNEQEDLMVWMRTAALPTFRKLYGKIEVDLQEGEVLTTVIQNNYNSYSFNGKKKLVLSTTTWIGGKNDFIAIAYLTVGGLCLFLAMLFAIIFLVKPRRLGDPSYLSWNRNPGGL